MTFNGPKIVFGVPDELKPVVTKLDGRQRFRFRFQSPAEVFIKTDKGIRRFRLMDEGTHWSPCFEIERNVRS